MALALKHYGALYHNSGCSDVLNKGAAPSTAPTANVGLFPKRVGAPSRCTSSTQPSRGRHHTFLFLDLRSDENEECTEGGIDPRFLLPALFSCLSECTSTKAAAAKKAHESGIASYCLAALASKSPATRNYAFGCLDLIGTYAKSSEAQEDPHSGAEGLCLLIDACTAPKGEVLRTVSCPNSPV